MTESGYFDWENELSGIIKTETDPLAEPATGDNYLKVEEPAKIEDLKEELPSVIAKCYEADETHTYKSPKN